MDTNLHEFQFPSDWGKLPDLPPDGFFRPLTEQDLKGFSGVSVEELEAAVNASEHLCSFVSIRG